MRIVIDGNNLIFAARDVDGDAAPIGREKLCAVIAQWGGRYAQAVSIVFDGPTPAGPLAAQIAPGGVVRVEYSGIGVTADARIAALIAADSAPRRLVVVSSDREIRRTARRRRAQSVRSDDFWRALRRELARPTVAAPPLEPATKQAGLAGDEVQEWLVVFGLASDALLTDEQFEAMLEQSEKRDAPPAKTAVNREPIGRVEDFGPAGADILRDAERLLDEDE